MANNSTFRFFALYLTNDLFEMPSGVIASLNKFDLTDGVQRKNAVIKLDSYRIYHQQRMTRLNSYQKSTTLSTNLVQTPTVVIDADPTFCERINQIKSRLSDFRYLIAFSFDDVDDESKMISHGNNGIVVKTHVVDYMGGTWKFAQDASYWFDQFGYLLPVDDQRYCIEVRNGARVGRVTGIIGPMFAGKTTKMIEMIEEMIKKHGQKVTVITLKMNDSGTRTRTYSSSAITTHDGKEFRDNVMATAHLFELADLLIPGTVLAIDELHLYSDAAYFVAFAQACGVDVIFCTISSGQFGTALLPTVDVIANANCVYRLTATCSRCGDKQANHSWRYTWTSQIAPTKHNNGQIEAIGGSEKYEALCTDCHHKATHEYLTQL